MGPRVAWGNCAGLPGLRILRAEQAGGALAENERLRIAVGVNTGEPVIATCGTNSGKSPSYLAVRTGPTKLPR